MYWTKCIANCSSFIIYCWALSQTVITEIGVISVNRNIANFSGFSPSDAQSFGIFSVYANQGKQMCDVCLTGKYSSGVSWTLIISDELESLDFRKLIRAQCIGININLTVKHFWLNTIILCCGLWKFLPFLCWFLLYPFSK